MTNSRPTFKQLCKFFSLWIQKKITEASMNDFLHSMQQFPPEETSCLEKIDELVIPATKAGKGLFFRDKDVPFVSPIIDDEDKSISKDTKVSTAIIYETTKMRSLRQILRSLSRDRDLLCFETTEQIKQFILKNFDFFKYESQREILLLYKGINNKYFLCHSYCGGAGITSIAKFGIDFYLDKTLGQIGDIIIIPVKKK